jgi:hypothetical protein
MLAHSTGLHAMNRLGIALLHAPGGYVVAAVLGYALILQFSGNVHDREVEAAMTGAFVAGPIGALAGLVAALLRRNRGVP